MSILESCAAVAIISTSMMIAVPTLLKAREDYALNATAREIASRMQSARIKAITRNRDCRFRVTSSVSYVVECQSSPAAWLPDEIGVLRPGFIIAANATPRFLRRGNVSPAATITVWNGNGRQGRVIVNITGRVRVE